MKAGRKGYYGFASKGQRRPRWFGAGLAIGVVAAILTGCSIFHKTSIGETPSPSTLDDMRSAKSLPGDCLPAAGASIVLTFTLFEYVWKASHGRYSTAFENISIVFSCSQL